MSDQKHTQETPERDSPTRPPAPRLPTDATHTPTPPNKLPLQRHLLWWLAGLVLLAAAVAGIVLGVGSLLQNPLVLTASGPPAGSSVSSLPAADVSASTDEAGDTFFADASAPPGSINPAASSDTPETELPYGTVPEDIQQRVAQALEQDGVERSLSFIALPLDEGTLTGIAGDNFTYAAWEGTPALGSATLLAWGLLGGEDGSLPAGAPPGIGGEDLYAVVGLSIDRQQVVLLDASRQPFSLPKAEFFRRVAQAGFYVQVHAVTVDVPYLSQLDYGLQYGCEVTALAMMMTHALGQPDAPLNPADLAAQMVYSPDGDPATGYVGDPYSDGWTTYVEPQMDFVAGIIGSAMNLTNYTYPGVADNGQNASSLARIRATLAQGVPVVAWLQGYSQGWDDYLALGITHCVVLTGFDADGFTLHDPYRANPEQNYAHLHFSADSLYQWMSAHDFRAMAY